MAGAFNIDIEVGSSKDGVKIYCASLTDNWTALRSYNELKTFYNKLSEEDAVKDGKIQIGTCPKENDTSGTEDFLSELGCTASVLRLKTFQDFLKVPMSVREGLSYAKHKPFGKTIKESELSRHPRYIRRGSTKKWIRLTQDDRGSSIITYANDHSTSKAQSALKLSGKSEMKILKEIQYAFVLKSGKRQWVLQATNQKDFDSWYNALKSSLEKVGAKVDSTNLKNQKTTSTNNNNNNNNNNYSNNNNVSNDIKQLQAENQKLKQEVEEWKKKYSDLEAKIDGDDEETKEDLDVGGATGDAGAIRKKLIKEFSKEKDDLIREYEIQHENLRTEIEELRKQLENKVAVENGKSGLTGLLGTGYQDEDELKAEIDVEKKQLDNLTEEEKATIKFVHTHLHRHAHKHIHHHRHVHIHDNTKKPPQTYTNTHTVSHTITHTNTQFQIKKASFF